MRVLLCTTTSARTAPRNFSTPTTINAGGSQKMIISHIRARQPIREPWTRERLVRERAIALGQAIDTSTWNNYSSALNSYLTFVCLHNLPVEPNADTLSFYTVWMCHHIKPDSVQCRHISLWHLPTAGTLLPSCTRKQKGMARSSHVGRMQTLTGDANNQETSPDN